ncbi:hypothetical protein DFH08DRAFT_284677 [Mycena albidolilacea]|uniref:Uncharacterized protein n=1 Tax=Mycena albidolilacea TaxID=1033008 RepID=A0AAD6ZRL0_9AGAR|nr:hypothetical protein DFH08DRAFT_284677 [Mycena albidolilacea]
MSQWPLCLPMDDKTSARRLPVNNPPPVADRPTYILACVCSPRTFNRNLRGGVLDNFSSCNSSQVISNKWVSVPGVPRLVPRPWLAVNNNYYLIAKFNAVKSDHVNRAHIDNADKDPVIQAARVAMGVDQDPSLEGTLQWYKWPLLAQSRGAGATRAGEAERH